LTLGRSSEKKGGGVYRKNKKGIKLKRNKGAQVKSLRDEKDRSPKRIGIVEKGGQRGDKTKKGRSNRTNLKEKSGEYPRLR